MFTLTSSKNQRRNLGKALALVAIAGALASCGNSSQLPAAITVSTKVATASNGDLEHRIFKGVNAYRSHQGIAQQTRHSGLDRMAREHARKMLHEGKLEHTNYEYREGVAVQRYKIENLEENILRAFRVQPDQMAATTVKGWIESRGHRINLESLNSHVGIGVALGENGSIYAVHLTGSPLRKSAFHAGLPRGYSNTESEHELTW